MLTTRVIVLLTATALAISSPFAADVLEAMDQARQAYQAGDLAAAKQSLFP